MFKLKFYSVMNNICSMVLLEMPEFDILWFSVKLNRLECVSVLLAQTQNIVSRSEG